MCISVASPPSIVQDDSHLFIDNQVTPLSPTVVDIAAASPTSIIVQDNIQPSIDNHVTPLLQQRCIVAIAGHVWFPDKIYR